MDDARERTAGPSHNLVVGDHVIRRTDHTLVQPSCCLLSFPTVSRLFVAMAPGTHGGHSGTDE